MVFSAPSGGGKTTICKKIARTTPEKLGFEAWYSISCTTRPPRGGEVDGKDYIFLTKEEFRNWIENSRLLEYEEVYGELYGTPIEPIEENLRASKVVLLDLDVKGAINLKKKRGDVCLIFILPPSPQTLLDRLKKRGDLNDKALKIRLSEIKKEIESAIFYDFVVVNDDLEETVKECIQIIKEVKERHESSQRLIDRFLKGLNL